MEERFQELKENVGSWVRAMSPGAPEDLLKFQKYLEHPNLPRKEDLIQRMEEAFLEYGKDQSPLHLKMIFPRLDAETRAGAILDDLHKAIIGRRIGKIKEEIDESILQKAGGMEAFDVPPSLIALKDNLDRIVRNIESMRGKYSGYLDEIERAVKTFADKGSLHEAKELVKKQEIVLGNCK